MIHDTVIDTSVVFPHSRGPPYKKALRTLCGDILQKIIQNDGTYFYKQNLSCLLCNSFKIANSWRSRQCRRCDRLHGVDDVENQTGSKASQVKSFTAAFTGTKEETNVAIILVFLFSRYGAESMQGQTTSKTQLILPPRNFCFVSISFCAPEDQEGQSSFFVIGFDNRGNLSYSRDFFLFVRACSFSVNLLILHNLSLFIKCVLPSACRFGGD